MRHGRRYTAKDRYHALNAYLANPGYKTRNALLMSHEALVIHICTRHFGAWRDYCWQDLLQEGRIALAKAIANYRPGLSDFGGHAAMVIRSHVGTFVSHEAREESSRVIGANTHSRKRSRVHARVFEPSVSLDALVGAADSNTRHDLVAADVDVEKQVINRNTLNKVKDLIGTRLTDRERYVMDMYFFSDKDLVQISKDLNMSHKQAAWIKGKAIRKIQGCLRAL
jgi:RNA polymerase sigma factor (sigma-70 family)